MEQKLRRDRRIGDNLRTLRDKHDISQEKLCEELQRRGCDIGRTTYAKYESGELNVRISVLLELKKIYQCSFDDFLIGIAIYSHPPIPLNLPTFQKQELFHSLLRIAELFPEHLVPF